MSSLASSLRFTSVGHPRAAAVGSASLRWAFTALLLSITVFQRFGVNFGSYSLNFALLAMYGLLAVAALSGALRLSATRLLLYGAALSIAVASFVTNAVLDGSSQSTSSSLMLLCMMYTPFLFVLAPRSFAENDTAWVLETFLALATFCALAGIAQFYLQFAFRPDWLFDFTPYIPSFLQGPSGYNTVIPVGASYKSNGFFMREPSGFSFLMAFALVTEAVTFKRPSRLACFGLALALTYSGTGLLALSFGILFSLSKRTIGRMLVLGSMGGAAAYALGDVLNLSFTLGRIGEFDSERSSAYIRYVAPLRLIDDTFGAEAWTPLLGHGPGAISREIQSYEFHDPTWAKLLFEYGALGFLVFLALFLLTLRGSPVPLPARAALFFSWLLMGGHLLSPEQNFLTLAIVGLIGGAEGPPVASTARLERSP